MLLAEALFSGWFSPSHGDESGEPDRNDRYQHHDPEQGTVLDKAVCLILHKDPAIVSEDAVNGDHDSCAPEHEREKGESMSPPQMSGEDCHKNGGDGGGE